MNDTRIERDAFGAIEVPAARLWGAQTQRSLQHFAISTERMPVELLRALAEVKRAAAQANGEFGLLDSARAGAIVAAGGRAQGDQGRLHGVRMPRRRPKRRGLSPPASS